MAEENNNAATEARSQLQETMDRLEQGVSEIFTSGQYQEYLSVMGRFHNYSLNNCLLIAMQKPDASLVAGYQAWQRKFGRQVNKGEKAIKIIAPAPRRITSYTHRINAEGQPQFDRDGQPIIDEHVDTRTTFKVSNVFDVSQTEGRELPNLGVESLVGDVERYDDAMKAIENIAPCPVVFENIESGAKGFFSFEPGNKRIVIQSDMEQAQTLKTTLHELAHARMHDFTEAKDTDNKPDRSTREVQAESVAFVVASHYGIDTSDYSFGYVAGWSSGKETPELKESMADIRTAAHEVISDLDQELITLEQEREANVKEQALFIPDYGYVHLQTRDEGWDYTLYTNEFAEYDGGIIEGDMTATDAREFIAALHDDIDLDDAINLDVDDFSEKLDQVQRQPYMRTIVKAMPKDQTAVTKSSMKLRRPQQAKHEHNHDNKPHEPKQPKSKELEIA